MTLILDGNQSHYAGAFLYLDGDQWVQSHDTLQCCHCDVHWAVVRGSGMVRGWCAHCQQAVCGSAPCMSECVPWERQMELIEAAARALGG